MNAQLRKIHAYSFIKSHNSLETVRYSHIVSGCVNVLSQYGYEGDINSEPVLSSAVRKLPRELQNKWMTYVLNHELIDKNMRVFSAGLKKLARVEDKIRWQFGSSSDKTKSTFNREELKNTICTTTSDSGSPKKS